MNSFSNQNETNMSQETAKNQQSSDSRKFPLNKIKSSDNCLPPPNSSSTSKLNNIKKQQSNNELVSNRLGLSTGQSDPPTTVLVPNPIKLISAAPFHITNEIDDASKTHQSVRVNVIESGLEQQHHNRSQTAIDAKSAQTDNQNESDAINQSLNSKLIINNDTSKRSAFRPFKSKKQSSSHHANEANESRKAFELSSTSSAASSSSSATDKNQIKRLTSTEYSSESKEMAEVDVEDEEEEVDEDDSAAENKQNHNTKRSAFAWVGKKMAK